MIEVQEDALAFLNCSDNQSGRRDCSRRKKLSGISDSTVEGRALRDEWGAWDWRTDRLFAPSSWEQHLSTVRWQGLNQERMKRQNLYHSGKNAYHNRKRWMRGVRLENISFVCSTKASLSSWEQHLSTERGSTQIGMRSEEDRSFVCSINSNQHTSALRGILENTQWRKVKQMQM